MKKVLLIRIILIAFGILGLVNTLLISRVSSLNLGVLLPAILGLPLLLMGLLWPQLSGGSGRVLKLLFFALYAVTFVAFSVTWLIIDAKASETDVEADVVIVLGAALRGEIPTLVLKYRLDTAVKYLNDHPNATAILSGGKGSGEHISEAEAMARYLERKGIAKDRYIKEDRSENTKENFLYSNEIIKEYFGSSARIAFVTTDFHVYRATLTAKRQGIDAVGLAAPDVWYISANNHLRECVALWAYTIAGNV